MAEAGELVHNVRLVYRHLVPREPSAWERLVLAVVGKSAWDVCEGVLIVQLKIKVENESWAFVYRWDEVKVAPELQGLIFAKVQAYSDMVVISKLHGLFILGIMRSGQHFGYGLLVWLPYAPTVISDDEKNLRGGVVILQGYHYVAVVLGVLNWVDH